MATKMIKGLTSIIMTCYDQTQTNRHVSMVAAANILRYTDMPYELIVVDCCPKYPFRDDYKIFQDVKFIEVPLPDIGYYAAMRMGASNAKGEYICFIENDVMVHEGWLDGLKRHLDRDL